MEDDFEWQEIFAEAFDGLPVEITAVSSLTAAREALANEGPFDAVVCDGNLTGSFDPDNQGHDLALELHRAGQKVAVFSTSARHADVPFFKKTLEEGYRLAEWVTT